MSKVALIRCESYDVTKVYSAIKKGLSLLGGLNQFVKKNEKILIKPNLLMAKSPDKHATTHPAIFEAMIQLLQEERVNIAYGDSPGFGKPENVTKPTGYEKVAFKYGIPLVDFKNGKKVEFSNAIQQKHFDIANGVLECDGIINLPKMKTHALTRITCAVKNTFGCVYGLNKPAFHIQYTNAVIFSKMLIDLNNLLKPRLHIVDGIFAMEGNGPAGGEPKKMNVIMISDDPVAIDSTFCKLIDLDPAFIPTNVFGEETGLGNYSEDKIEYVGDDINSFIQRDFDILREPVKNENIMGFLKPFKNLLIRKPVINKEKCIKCGICVEECPVEGNALNFKNTDKNTPPVYNYSKCIRCYCCQEMCPQKAIDIKTPILGKILLNRK